MPKRGYADVVDKDPTKGMSKEESIGRGREKLGESDRRSLQLQVAQDEEALAHANAMKMGVPEGTRERLERNKMILGHDDDLTPKSDGAKNRLFARSKELETLLKANMPTKREMWPKTGSPEAQQAVRHNVKFQEQYSEQCREWQDIQKKLNPDDPYAQSLELIRPD